MLDSFGRHITYLRLSLTERCTLKCSYCRKDEGECPKAEELSADEFIRLTRVFADLGIQKVRLTGGEPLLRHEILEIVAGISRIPGVSDLSLTTNGQFLAPLAKGLKAAGLERVNISLDSLNPITFNKLTGGDLQLTLEGIQAAIEAGLTPVRLNCVLMRGVNDGEAEALLRLTKENPIDMRFIEYMPIGENPGYAGVSNQELIDRFPDLIAVPPRYPFQVAKEFRLPGHLGRVGLICAISDHFCGECNRIRVTSDGKARPCLASDVEIDLRDALKKHDDAGLEALIRQAVWAKPRQHQFGLHNPVGRNMRRIGG